MENNTIDINDTKLEEMAREEARKYKAEWRKRNKDKVRETNKRYWIKRALARKEREAK